MDFNEEGEENARDGSRADSAGTGEVSTTEVV
jgi:hypothetical protein